MWYISLVGAWYTILVLILWHSRQAQVKLQLCNEHFQSDKIYK